MKLLKLIPLAFVLAGCASPVSDMLNNKFLSITPNLQNKSLVGNWTGTMGPYLVTVQINSGGSGLWCYSYGSVDAIQKVKVSGNLIYIQDGTKVEIENVKKNNITVKPPYFGGEAHSFYSDPSLDNASRYCASEL